MIGINGILGFRLFVCNVKTEYKIDMVFDFTKLKIKIFDPQNNIHNIIFDKLLLGQAEYYYIFTTIWD